MSSKDRFSKTLLYNTLSLENRSAAQTIAIRCKAWGFSTVYHKKEVDGKQTRTPCIRFYVFPKIRESACKEQGILIPESIGGVATDVIEMKPMVMQKDIHQERHDELQGGISFVHFRCTAATLGIILQDKTTKKPKELSNTHVIYNVDNPGGDCSDIGDPQLQPGPSDGGIDPSDRVGNGERYIPFTAAFPGGIGDAACATWNGERNVNLAEILHLGKIKGVKDPEIGMHLRGCCRNGDFEATIFDIAVSVQVSGLGCVSHDKYCVLQKQVMYAPGLGPGSSGTCMISDAGYAVVLNSFGNAGPGQGQGGGCWMSNIMEPLNLEWPGEAPPPPPPEGEFEFSLDDGETWTRAKTMRIRGVSSNPTTAKIKVSIDGQEAGSGEKVEAELTEQP